MNALITLKHITKTFGNRSVLEDVCLDIDDGEYISVIGESGAGKSTLMNIIGLLDSEFGGEYLFRGAPIDRKHANLFRNEHVGYIFQQYNLLPTLTAYDNVMLPYAFSDKNYGNIEERAETLFRHFGLWEIRDQEVAKMSGGEKQRVALIRSIILEPEILIADEPTGNLDSRNAQLTQTFLEEMHQQGKTIIVVTHDEAFAKKADRIYRIQGGRLDEIS